MYKHIVALMEECDDEDKVGNISSLLHLRQTVGERSRSIPASIYTRPGGSVISSLSEVDYTGGAVDSDEKVGYQPGSTIRMRVILNTQHVTFRPLLFNIDVVWGRKIYF